MNFVCQEKNKQIISTVVAFTTYGEPNSKEDMDLLLATRSKLEMQGYGKKKKPKAKPKKPKPKKPKPKKK